MRNSSIIFLGQRLQALDDVLFAHHLERAVAAQAALKGLHLIRQVEPPQHLYHLQAWVGLVDAISTPDCLAHQQSPVTRQQHAVFLDRNLGQLIILVIIAVQAVEPQHAQVSRQLTQVVIQDKARLTFQGKCQQGKPSPGRLHRRRLEASTGLSIDHHLPESPYEARRSIRSGA